MSNKINNTYTKAIEQIEQLQKVFRQGGKLDSALLESAGDTSSLPAVNRAFNRLLEELQKGTAQTLTEGVLDDGDEDGFMARSQLYFMAKDAIQLHGMIDDRDDLEPWVHSKIVAASEGIDSVRRYIEYRKQMGDQPQPEMEPQEKPAMLAAEASSSRMVREIEHLVKELDDDMNMNRHYGDVNIAKVVQMVQAGDIEGAAEEAVSGYHDDDGGQDSSVLDGAYADMIDDLKWIVDNVSESFSHQVKDFGMFSKGGNGQIQNGIEHILRKFTDDALAGTEGDRDRLRAEAHQELQKMLEEMSEEDKYEEAMDTDVRQRAAAYLEKGIVRVYNMLDIGSKMKKPEVEEGWEELPAMPDKYTERDGLEGPIMTRSGKVVYYDPKAGNYYDPDSDMYMSYDDFRMLDKKGMHKVDEAKKKQRLDPKCWDGYKIGNPKTKMKGNTRVNNCVPESAKEGIEAMKKAGNAKADAEAKERKKSKVEEGMEFDEKRNDDLQTVAKDMFAHAKSQAKKSLKIKKAKQ